MDRDHAVIEKKIVAEKLHAAGKPDWKAEVPDKDVQDFFARHARELKEHGAAVVGNAIEFSNPYDNVVVKKKEAALAEDGTPEDKTAYLKKIAALKEQGEDVGGPRKQEIDDKTVYLKKLGSVSGAAVSGSEEMESFKGSVNISY